MDEAIITSEEEQNVSRFLGSLTPTNFNKVIKLSKEIRFAIKTARPHTEKLREKYKNFEKKFYSILLAIAWVESTFERDAVGRHGEIGVFQIKIPTARGVNKKYELGYITFISELGNLRSSSIIAAHLIVDNLKRRESFKQAIKLYNQGTKLIYPGKDSKDKIDKRIKAADSYYGKVNSRMRRIRKQLNI